MGDYVPLDEAVKTLSFEDRFRFAVGEALYLKEFEPEDTLTDVGIEDDALASVIDQLERQFKIRFPDGIIGELERNGNNYTMSEFADLVMKLTKSAALPAEALIITIRSEHSFSSQSPIRARHRKLELA